MSITHRITQGYQTPEGTVSSVSQSYTDDAAINIDASVADGETAQEIDVAVTLANLKSCSLSSDKAVTIKTNSSSTPQETITLTAGQAIVWGHDHVEDAPFSGNLTKFYVANASGAAARIRFSALLHQSV